MNTRFCIIPALCLAVFTASCAPRVAPEPEKTQLEIREYQTRIFDVNDYSGVMKSILDVLQDDGFMVKSVHAELGFLSASKDIGLNSSHWADDDDDFSGDFGFGFSIGRGSSIGVRKRFPNDRRARPVRPTHECIEATINVSQFGEKVRVRASFQSKVFGSNEAVLRVQQITDEQFYQDFFSKVDKGVFLQQQQI